MKLSKKLEELSKKITLTDEESKLYQFLTKLSRLDSLLVDRFGSTYLIVGLVEEEGRVENSLYCNSSLSTLLRFKKIDIKLNTIYFKDEINSNKWLKDRDGLVLFNYTGLHQHLLPYRVIKLEFDEIK